MKILQHRYALVAAAAVAVIGWGALLVAPAGASAAIVTINSTIHGNVGDGNPMDGTPDSSDNTSVFIANANAPGFVARHRPIIEFDISGLTGAATLAELSLTGLGSGFISAPFNQTRSIDVLGYTGDGVLSLSDFSAGSALTSFNYTQGSGNTNVTLDVTSFINARIAASDTWAGFVLDLPTVTGNQFAIFGNTIAGAATFPDLNVTPVPLPAALTLFLSALTGLGVFGWRRRTKPVA